MALALVTSTALAGPKGGGKGGGKGSGSGTAKPSGGGSGSGSGSGSDSGDIEMDDKGGGGGSGAKGSGSGGGSGSAVDSGEIQMDEDQNKPADLSADIGIADQSTGVVKAGPVKKTPLSWKDIVVVVRKPFLKAHRTELFPFVGVTMNDNMIQHEAIGGELAYYLTDVLAIGVEGQYMVHSFQEPFDLVARQARRLPTVNQYNWQAALDFHYVPVYGKFALLDKKLVTWEVFFTAGVGAGQSEVIPRDTKFPGFTNLLIQPNLGASMRFFPTKWLTVSLGIRDYMFIDKFEPTNRSLTMNTTAAEAQANADSSFINNIMFQIGLSFWLPTSFEYTTFR